MILQCRRCLLQIFSVFELGNSPQLHSPFDGLLRSFFGRSAKLHLDAVNRQSSLYSATERFIVEHAGRSTELMAFAVLRKEYDLAPSPAAQRPYASALTAAQDDLVFGFVFTDSATNFDSLDAFLRNQSVVDLLGSERTKRAIWDLSRLPPGSHLPDSDTYAWLQRSLRPIRTR